MFELSISNTAGNAFPIGSGERKFFDATIHETITYDDAVLSVNGLRYKGETDDFLNTDEHLVVVCGKVFYRLGAVADKQPLKAEHILSLYRKKGKGFEKELKGNFILFIYSKAGGTFTLSKDQLGLRYLYYKQHNKNFWISTNLNDFKTPDYKVNYCAVLEKLVFSYPISEESFIENVLMLGPGKRICSANPGISVETWFDVNELFTQQPRRKFDETEFVNLFESSVLQRASVSQRPVVSLTGGFDGRANVAVLLNNELDFKAYSFGRPGGENTEVPLNVSRILHLDYMPVRLDGGFEAGYSASALAAIELSDGISVFERANYIYSGKRIAKFSHYNITGLIGGEVFSPVHQKTDYINENYYNIIYGGVEADPIALLTKSGIIGFLNPDCFFNEQTLSKFKEHIRNCRQQVNAWRAGDFEWMYYMKDLINRGFRHFYGNQMHLERYYAENLSPFYDIDLLAYLFSSDYIDTYKNAFKSSVLLRRNNRRLQSLIIRRCYAPIGEIPVDRGYPPNYNLDFRKVLIPWIFYKRKKESANTTSDFDSKTWCGILYKEKGGDLQLNDQMGKITVVREFMATYKRENYNRAFNNLLGILNWTATAN